MDVDAHIHSWKWGCIGFAAALDVIVFIVWIGGRLALEGLKP